MAQQSPAVPETPQPSCNELPSQHFLLQDIRLSDVDSMSTYVIVMLL